MYLSAGPGLVSGGPARLDRLKLSGLVVALTRTMEEMQACPLPGDTRYKHLFYAANLEAFLRFAQSSLSALRIGVPAYDETNRSEIAKAFRETFETVIPEFPDEFLTELAQVLSSVPTEAAQEVAFAQRMLMETFPTLIKCDHEEIDVLNAIPPDEDGFFKLYVELTRSIEDASKLEDVSARIVAVEHSLTQLAEQLSHGRFIVLEPGRIEVD